MLSWKQFKNVVGITPTWQENKVRQETEEEFGARSAVPIIDFHNRPEGPPITFGRR